MFSFFKRSKKETESKENKEKRANEYYEDALPTLDMCKNKAEISPQGGKQQSSIVLPEIAVWESGAILVSGDVVSETNDASNLSSENLQNESMNRGNVAFTYANMLRKSELAKEGKSQSVKPCGHGTVAIAPRVPPSAARRENNATPPDSPKTDVKVNHFKSKNSPARSDDAILVDPAALLRHNGRKGSLNENCISRKLSVDPTSEPICNGDDKKNLVNQETKFQSQLNELSKQLSHRDGEANKLRFQMDELQRDVFTKSAGMDRLQAELREAHKESEHVKQKLRNLEEDLERNRQQNSNLTTELSDKTGNR